MKRRDFLKGTLLAAGVATILGKASGLFNQAMAAVLHVKEGALGYKAIAPANQVKAGKQCSSCHWYKADTAEAGSGKCTLVAMTNVMKSKDVYVKDAGYCNMWKKKA